MNRLTEQQQLTPREPNQEDYQLDMSCPFCKREVGAVEQGEFYWDACSLQRRLKCSECGRVWEEHYVLEELDLQPSAKDSCTVMDEISDGDRNDSETEVA